MNFEGDSLIVIKKIKDKNIDRSSLSVIIQEIKQRSIGIKSFTSLFVRHLTNQAAHVMVVEGKRWSNQTVWIEEPPNGIEKIAERDRSFAFKEGNRSEENDSL